MYKYIIITGYWVHGKGPKKVRYTRTKNSTYCLLEES